MFSQNPYINELFDEYADIRCLDWNDFYNMFGFKFDNVDYTKDIKLV